MWKEYPRKISVSIRFDWRRRHAMLIVVKAGGRVLENGLPPEVATDIKTVSERNRMIFVHGGGIEVTKIAQELGKEQRFIVSPDGFRSRYTDRDTVDIYTMVMVGKLNKQIVSALESKGVKSLGLSGLDGQLIKAERKKKLVVINERGRKMAIDGGYTGKIEEINTDLIRLIMEAGYLLVVSPVAMSEEYEPLNVDGDRTAAKIAAAMKADVLLLLTDVEGLIVGGKVVPRIRLSEAKKMLPEIGPGMITKIHAAIEALEHGVKEVIITSGAESTPLSSAINHSVGTVIENE
jgi:acetylglutamate/LysW-gamma-L-alpha-aminoadipate kinase